MENREISRAARERLLERYLSGGMTSVEEEDFFIRVALDKELRQELKAQRVVDDALRKDKEQEPAQHTALRSQVAMLLAAAPAAHDAASTGVPTSVGSTGGNSGGFFSGALFKGISAALGVAAVTVGGFLVAPLFQDAEPVTNTPAVERQVTPDRIDLPSPAAEGAPRSTHEAVQGIESNGISGAETVQERDLPKAAATSERNNTSALSRSSVSEEAAGSNSQPAAKRTEGEKQPSLQSKKDVVQTPVASETSEPDSLPYSIRMKVNTSSIQKEKSKDR